MGADSRSRRGQLPPGCCLPLDRHRAQTITSKRAQAEAIMAAGRQPERQPRADDRGLQLREHPARSRSTPTSRRTRSTSPRRRRASSSRRQRIAERLRDLYINGQGDSTLEVILGSSSLDDIIARLDAIERVSSQDAQILRTVKRYRKEVETRRANLREGARRVRRRSSRSARRRSSRSSRSSPSRTACSPRSRTRSRRCAPRRRGRQAALAAQARLSAQAAQPRAAGAAGRRATRRTTSRATTRRRTTRTSRQPRYGRRRRRSRCSTSASRTCGAARARRPASTARASRATSTRRSASTLPHHAASQYGYGNAGSVRPARAR